MSEHIANRTYRLDDGTEFSSHIAVDPESLVKQYEKDIYDSGVFAGIKFEGERIMQILNDPKLFAGWSDHGFSEHGEMLIYRDRLMALIKGEK